MKGKRKEKKELTNGEWRSRIGEIVHRREDKAETTGKEKGETLRKNGWIGKDGGEGHRKKLK